MDAVIAIVMTILVLELEKPAEPTLEALWDLRINFAAYAMSFLWLASMWSCLHNAWHYVTKVSSRTIWLSIALLFFSSLFPYATSLIATYFDSAVIQAFYALDVIATMLMLFLIHRSLAKDEPNPTTSAYMMQACHLMIISVIIMVVGAILGQVFWSPLLAVGLLAAAIFITVKHKKNFALPGKEDENADADADETEEEEEERIGEDPDKEDPDEEDPDEEG